MSQILSLIRRWSLAALCVLIVTPAYAQRSVSDKAAAEALFDEALELMSNKRYTEACPKLEESQRIDAGIGTLLYLAECYEKSGRTASAWATFREAASAASAAGQADRARQGKARADRLEPNLSKLTVRVAAENKAISGFQVTRSGEPVQASLFDAAVPVDPGQLVIEATAPGYEPFTKTVTIPANGGRAEIQVPALAPGTGAAEPVPPAATGAGAATSGQAQPGAGQEQPSMSTADAGTDAGGTSRTVGVVLMGVGAAGLVVGTIFGVEALKKDSDAQDICGNDTSCPTDKGEQLSDDAQQAALVSTIGFIAGGGALVAGAVLYLTAPDGSEAGRVQLSPVAGGAQFSFSGRF
ncbi:MAG TPA: hypothetical protein VFU02_16950 [Polyangiaceae bacterium]|nr:hypothetical protein [Polyangiaceae bacterium]